MLDSDSLLILMAIGKKSTRKQRYSRSSADDDTLSRSGKLYDVCAWEDCGRQQQPLRGISRQKGANDAENPISLS